MKYEKIKVLHIVGSLGQGGIQTFILNIYRSIYREVTFDFLLFNSFGREDYYEKEIRELGGKVFHIHNRRSGILRNYREMKSFLLEHQNEYKAVHYHAASASYILPIKLVNKFQYPIRIIHCHNTKQSGSKWHTIFHYFNRQHIEQYATHYFACSKLAAEWMYPKNLLEKSVIVKNGIEVQKFIFSNELRKRTRDELGISDECFVCGNVARFHEQKNHKFLIDIFMKIQELNPNSILLLIGEGKLKQKIYNKVKKLNLENKVYFLGTRGDINDLMNAMDAFVFPSLYEGLGIVLIEAQAAGVQCFASDNVIPQEVNITKQVNFISLSQSAEFWAKEIVDHEIKGRVSHAEDIIEAGYDINSSAKYLLGIYCESLETNSGEACGKYIVQSLKEKIEERKRK